MYEAVFKILLKEVLQKVVLANMYQILQGLSSYKSGRKIRCLHKYIMIMLNLSNLKIVSSGRTPLSVDEYN